MTAQISFSQKLAWLSSTYLLDAPFKLSFLWNTLYRKAHHLWIKLFIFLFLFDQNELRSDQLVKSDFCVVDDQEYTLVMTAVLANR